MSCMARVRVFWTSRISASCNGIRQSGVSWKASGVSGMRALGHLGLRVCGFGRMAYLLCSPNMRRTQRSFFMRALSVVFTRFARPVLFVFNVG